MGHHSHKHESESSKKCSGEFSTSTKENYNLKTNFFTFPPVIDTGPKNEYDIKMEEIKEYVDEKKEEAKIDNYKLIKKFRITDKNCQMSGHVSRRSNGFTKLLNSMID